MRNIEKLKNSTRKLLPSDIDKDLAVRVDGELIFLTNVFKDGVMLGFWSHSPWGRVHNCETGWMLVASDLTEIDSFVTKSSFRELGSPMGNESFCSWRNDIKDIHGRSLKLCPEWENSTFWKMSEA